MNFLHWGSKGSNSTFQDDQTLPLRLSCSTCSKPIDSGTSAQIVYDYDIPAGTPVDYRIVHNQTACEQPLAKSHPRSLSLKEFVGRLQPYTR